MDSARKLQGHMARNFLLRNQCCYLDHRMYLVHFATYFNRTAKNIRNEYDFNDRIQKA